MSERTPMEFLLPPGWQLAPWLESLAELGQPVTVREGPISLRIFDTFDQRLLKAGWLFGIEEKPPDRQMVCRDDQGRYSEAPSQNAPPRFAADLPPLACRGPLGQLLDVRALLPQLELFGECSEWRLDGPDGEARAHLRLDRLVVVIEQVRYPLQPRLRVTPLKGYRKWLWDSVAEWRLRDDLIAAEENVYAAATRALGEHSPQAPPPLPVIEAPDMRANAAAKQVFRHLLATLRANEPGVLAEVDTEFLHDYRVAVRRTRTALGQMGAVFPPRVTERFQRGFQALAQATSLARDLDVFLLALDDLDAQLPAPLQGQLEPLREVMNDLAREAHRRLNVRLRSAAHQRFMAAWSAFLDRPVPPRPNAASARLTVRELAGRRVWELYRRLLKEGRAITSDSPPAALHELRKTAKKLRYQLELFQSVFPADKIPPLVRRLKPLQTHLGEYQDIGVQVGHLRDWAEKLRTGRAPTATLLAIGALLGGLHARESQVRGGFADHFDKFASSGQRRKYRQAFRPTPTLDWPVGEPAG